MMYIDTISEDGSAIYFDVHTAERLGHGVRISGTIGDGCYEGEVLIELGPAESVTFADAWLGGLGYNEFVGRCDLSNLQKDLLESVREMTFFHAPRMQPHGFNRKTRESVAGEDLPLWNKRF